MWAIRSGDEGAMATLYDRYSSLVYAVALRVLGDTGAAEDVLQEVFMQLWRNPAAFDSSRGNLGAWLGVITRNRAIDGHATDRMERQHSKPQSVSQSLCSHLAQRHSDPSGNDTHARIGPVNLSCIAMLRCRK